MMASELVTKEERKYLKSLEDFFVMTWGETQLPSHDLSHHRRVWEYIKELLDYCKEYEHDSLIIRKLLMASYLHDIGMSADKGIKHGYHSRKLAEKFMMSNKINLYDYQDVLNAIENHDNKDYDKVTSDNRVLRILSLADDLDAFGQTGIDRYIEIYLARGVPNNTLVNAILENAAARFANFERFAAGKPALYEKHSKRYSELREFFENYNQHRSHPSSVSPNN